MIGGRLPRQDPETNMATCDIYSLDAIQINICYLDQLRRLFTRWVHQNQNGKMNVTWKELSEGSEPGTMIARSFLQMCRSKSLIPNLFNVELLHEFFQMTLPPITQGEIDFFEREELIKWYNDENASGGDEPMTDDKGDVIEPSLQFHEFIYLLGLIARKCITTSTNIR